MASPPPVPCTTPWISEEVPPDIFNNFTVEAFRVALFTPPLKPVTSGTYKLLAAMLEMFTLTLVAPLAGVDEITYG